MNKSRLLLIVLVTGFLGAHASGDSASVPQKSVVSSLRSKISKVDWDKLLSAENLSTVEKISFMSSLPLLFYSVFVDSNKLKKLTGASVWFSLLLNVVNMIKNKDARRLSNFVRLFPSLFVMIVIRKQNLGFDLASIAGTKGYGDYVAALGIVPYLARYIIEIIAFLVNRSPWAQSVIKKTLRSLGYNVGQSEVKKNVQKETQIKHRIPPAVRDFDNDPDDYNEVLFGS